jgi:subtilisin family serine protease
VAAAGDSGALGFPVDNFPASFPECLSVGGIDRMRKRSKYSTRSNFLDLMAPGENLVSMAKPGKKINGTSFAAPFVAGVTALLKSAAKLQETGLSNSELYDILKRTADKNVQGTYNISEHGWGIIDPLSALNMLNLRINYFK